MTPNQLRLRSLAGAAVLLAGSLWLAGCHLYSHPNDVNAINQLLAQNDLLSVTPSQDRELGVITLNGLVDTPNQKTRAETLARQAAPSYTIVDKLQIQPTGLESELKAATAASQRDQQIAGDYRASIKKAKDLKARNIHYYAQGGTLYLKGSVKTEAERNEAGEIAKKVPQVQNVVNAIVVTSTQLASAKP